MEDAELQAQDGDGRDTKRLVSWNSGREEALGRRGIDCSNVPEKSTKAQIKTKQSENNRQRWLRSSVWGLERWLSE